MTFTRCSQNLWKTLWKTHGMKTKRRKFIDDRAVCTNLVRTSVARERDIISRHRQSNMLPKTSGFVFRDSHQKKTSGFFFAEKRTQKKETRGLC